MDWLHNLQVGDEVIVSTRWYGRFIGKVERATATQLVVNGIRYSRKSGRQTGDHATINYLEEPTPERVAGVREATRRKGLIERLRHADFDALTTEQLATMVAILGQPRQEPGSD